ncbi:WASH complex subunit 2C-like isoform X1 [Notechis scutatus]|uniref:WASH complex subunit 2C-like isoform X1 n=1 Tax=Notechis scutatus TaxID=8663 RepID=A0A6J1U1A6_9SAUR|nr:WASH complex subunit 2C-like isoform X1 [Notechis scutatus]
MSSPTSSSSASDDTEASSGAGATKEAAAAAAAALLLWERAWSLEEIRSRSQTWSLAADAGLLQFLQEFSQQTISRTHEIKKQMDRLIHETKSIDCRLHNVFNGFLMLSNMQFIENRVYDDEMDELVSKSEGGDKLEQEKTREQKEADLIPKIQEAINFGLQVLDSAFEQLDIKAGNSDSEEETNERLELILEPKDLYVDRPLPYLIGSQLFMEQDDVGLADPSSEEGSVDGDHGSLIDSEGKEEEELEEFGTISDEDQKQRTVLMSDEDEDLFGDYEKGEEEDGDLEENTTLKRPTSFTDELTARIKREELSKEQKEQLYTKNKTTVTIKEDVNADSDDEDIFKPPKLTDEDFSPFGSKDGLFSGGTGLFDDDEKDLFAELPKEGDSKEKEARIPINGKPSLKAVKKVPPGAVSLFPGINDVFSPSSVPLEEENKKLTESITDKSSKPYEAPGLFEEDDNFESSKSSSIIPKSSVDFFDVDGDLFKEKPDTVNIAKNSQHSSAEKFKNLTPTHFTSQKNLFSDDEDSEDLFSSRPPIEAKNSTSSTKVMSKTALSLFEDEEEEDLFGSVPNISKSSQERTATLFLSSDEEDHCNNKKEVKATSEGSKKKEPMKSAYGASQAIKRGLFEEGGEGGEDDFAVTTKDSNKKTPQKSAVLFEDGTLHCSSQPTLTSPQPASSDAQTITLPTDQQENFLETHQKKLVEKKAGPSEESSLHHGYDFGEGGNVLEQQRKEKLFLEKDGKKKMRSVFSLFEDEEKNEVMDSSKTKQIGMGKPSEKSTGVFQDEELLFSRKLQEDNDPEVDLFDNKTGISSPKAKSSSGEWLFGTDDSADDGLFSNSAAKPLVPEKKTIIKKDSPVLPLEKDSKVLQNNQHDKQGESKIQATEGELEIHPKDKPYKKTTVKPPLKGPSHLPDDTKHTKVASIRNTTELGVSFDNPMKASTLQNVNKGRIKVSGNRRPPTRPARRLAVEELDKNEINTAENKCLPILKGNSGPPTILHHSKQHRKKNSEKSCLVPSANSSNQPNESKCSPLLKSTAYSDLFESNNLSTKDSNSKATLEAKGIVSQTAKNELFPAAQEGTSCDDLFHSRKTLRKLSPVPFPEEEQDVFITSKKTVKRKEQQLPSQSHQSFAIQDIFEDDIFAVETVKLPDKAKEVEVNLFDDDVDIFADLAVKSKEKSTRKKIEAVSIFDEDTDDIFSPTSQSKTSTKKTTFQSVSGRKNSEPRTASTFDDPLNAFQEH